MSCQNFKLNNGANMPQLGLGTFLSGPNEVKNAVISAIKHGYRSIDTAMVYNNEFEIGEALKECIPSICKREDLFITTKLWITDYDEDEVESALKVSLHKLGLSYVDLYLMHQPVKNNIKIPKRNPTDYKNWLTNAEQPNNIPFSKDWLMPTWRALEKCVEKGLTKAIGISNFNVKKIKSFINDCKIKPAVNQIECHPGLSQKHIVDYCLSNNIQVMAYCPLGNPVLKDTSINGTDLFNNEIIKTISKKYNKTPSQIMIIWGLQRNTIVIPKSVHENRIIENYNVFDVKLSKEDMDKIESIECGFRIGRPTFFFTDEKLIKEFWEED